VKTKATNNNDPKTSTITLLSTKFSRQESNKQNITTQISKAKIITQKFSTPTTVKTFCFRLICAEEAARPNTSDIYILKLFVHVPASLLLWPIEWELHN
jgi:hypothetical protein